MKNPIFPCLWFDENGKQAAEFYCSVFKNSKIAEDTPLVVQFESAGQQFMFLNGGPHFKINPSISFYVVCETKEEIDSAWAKLIDGGMALMPIDKYDWSERYGWVQDKFGVNWQLSLGKMEDVGQKFTPSLMFVGEQHGKTEQAIEFYTSLFENSEVVGVLKYTKEDNDTEGTVKHAQFKLNGQVFMAMDSSYDHQFRFNEAISFVVTCETQEEIDYYWNKLSAIPEAEQCGWLKDKFGISWQIVPAVLAELMSNPQKAPKATKAFMKMKKFDIEALVKASE